MLVLLIWVGARLVAVEEDSDPERTVFCTHHERVDRCTLAHDVQTHSGPTGPEGMRRFGDRLPATRRFLSLPGYCARRCFSQAPRWLAESASKSSRRAWRSWGGVRWMSTARSACCPAGIDRSIASSAGRCPRGT